ncbi:hypothetical protein N7586_13060 [Acinetobacter ursingii]|nr:hypothetical protein [Acinetobacter ursingii]MDG9993144.1 hypothetical protein [Acinetobacter ursingii]MDH0205456.1 hypothetical protein [Acinetobacter ursingii]
MTPLRMILNDAAERYEFESPYKNINNLKESKVEVHPFSLEQVQLILKTARDDFKPYYTIHFFTGMRTSEIDGLRWENVNLQRREIYVRESAYISSLKEQAAQNQKMKSDKAKLAAQASWNKSSGNAQALPVQLVTNPQESKLPCLGNAQAKQKPCPSPSSIEADELKHSPNWI